MPRNIRQRSEENIYHIVLKSINSQRIFNEDSDFEYFINSFYNSCKDYDVKIYAYCVMSNHIHLLLRFRDNNLANLFKAFGAKYVPKYNYHHQRTGPLFNGRYYSKPVNDDKYLLAALRYIHFNPVRAGVCKAPEEYRWSSYAEYMSCRSVFTDISYIMDIIDGKQFEELHNGNNNSIEDFIIDYRINPNSAGNLKNVGDRLTEQYSVEEIVEAMKAAGISKSVISQMLQIDRRSI